MSPITAIIRQQQGWKFVSLPAAPVPADLVRVNVALAGLCRTDIQCMTGQLHVTDGQVIGHEAAGWVEHIPQSLHAHLAHKGIHPGSRVAFFPFLPCHQCSACRQGHLEACHHSQSVGVDRPGAFASYVDLPAEVLFAAPDNLSWKHLAYAEPVCAAMALAELSLLSSSSVAVVGRGRIGRLTCQVLQEVLGHEVDLLDPDDQHIPASTYDVVVETWPSSQAMALAVRALRPQGLLVVKSRPARGVVWPHKDIVMKSLRMQGAPYGSFQKGLEWMASGKLNVESMFGSVFPWSQHGVEDALQEEQQSSEQSGKIFFNISGQAP